MCVVLAIAAVGVTACSSGDSGSGKSSGKKITLGATPTSGCGSYVADPPKDPDGVVKDIDNATYSKGLAGYPIPVLKSTWSDFKPNGSPPYTVGVVWNQLTAPFQIGAIKGIKDTLKSSPDVGSVLFSSTGANTDVGQELQNMNALLRQKPDIIILEPLTSASFAKQIKQAAAANIPVLLALDSYDSPNVVNVGGNNTLSAAASMSALVRLMGEKGNYIDMHGLPGTTPDLNSDDGIKAVVKNCPNIKKVTDLYGQFIPSVAKAETLKYLGTNPAPVQGVFQTATMASGVMQAFDQAGRDIPPVTDIGVTKGSLGYWRQNKDSYTGTGTGLGGIALGSGMANVAIRMLEGQGLKTNAVIQELPVLTDANLNQWAEPGWDLNTPGVAEGPPGAFGSNDFLNPLFANGAPPKTK